MKRITVPLQDFFSGGQNDKDSSLKIDPNQGQQVQNCFVDNVRGISTQEKAVKAGSLPAGDNGQGLFSYKRLDGTDYLIGVNEDGATSGIYVSQDGSTWTQAADQAGNPILFNSTNSIVEGVTLNGLFYLTTGYSVYTFDGTDWLPTGCFKVSDSGTAGNPNGTYYYVLTYTVNGEEIQSEQSFTITVVNHQINLTKISLGPVSITTKRTIYRTKNGGTQLYKVADIADNTTISYVDNIADTSLTVDIPTGLQGVPHAFYLVIHQNKLYYLKTTTNPNYIYWGFPDAPHVVSVNSYFQLNVKEEVIWGGYSYAGDLIIPTDFSVFVLQGDGIYRQYEMERRISNIGSKFFRSLQTYFHGEQQLLPLMSRYGVYAYDGSKNPVRISDPIQNTFNSLAQPDIEYGSKLFDTEAEWQTGAVDLTLDTTTVPDTVQLSQNPYININAPINNCSYYIPPTLPAPAGWITNFTAPGPISLPVRLEVDAFGAAPTFSSVFNMILNLSSPTKMDQVIFVYDAIIINGGVWNMDWLIVNYFDQNGSEFPLFTTPNTGTGVNITTPLPEGTIVTGFRIMSSVTYITKSSSNDTFRYNFNNIFYLQKTYQQEGSWTSPVIDTTLATSKKWGSYITDQSLNNQQISHLVRSGSTWINTSIASNISTGVQTVTPASMTGITAGRYVTIDTGTNSEEVIVMSVTPTTFNANFVMAHTGPVAVTGINADFAYINPGATLPFATTDRYFQERFILSLTPSNSPLYNLYNSKTYQAELNPDSPALTIHNSPDILNSPFTEVSFYPGTPHLSYFSINDPQALDGKSLQVGLGNEYVNNIINDLSFERGESGFSNTSGWQIETRIKFNLLNQNPFPLYVSDGVRFVGVVVNNANNTYQSTGNVSLIGVDIHGDYLIASVVTNVFSDGKYHTVKLAGKLNSFQVYIDGNLYLSATDTSSVSSTKKIWFNFVDTNAGSFVNTVNTLYYIDYLSWALVYGGPSSIDNTTTPIVRSTFASWLTSTSSIIPVTTAAAVYYKNRYWLAATEIRSPLEDFNNVIVQIDKNGKWIFRRGITGGARNCVAAFAIFKDNLWWIDSENVDLYTLQDKPGALTLPTTPDPRDITTFWTKQENFNTDNEKRFEKIYMRYMCYNGIQILANVDGKITTFTLPSTNGVPTEIFLSFIPNGNHIGKTLFLEITNNITGSNILDYFEVYDMEITMLIYPPSIAPTTPIAGAV